MAAHVGIRESLPIFRDGLRAEFTRASWIVQEPRDIVAWAGAGATAHRQAAGDDDGSHPGRAVLLSLSTDRDWSVLDQLHDRCPGVIVVTLLSQPRSDRYLDAIARGAMSAAPRSATGRHIVAVVRAAIDGQALLPATVVKALTSHDEGSHDPRLLKDEERRWLTDLANGESVDALAWRNGYSRRTMYRRLSQIYRRLGADRRESALVAAARSGLI